MPHYSPLLWVDVPGFEGAYVINRLGTIKSLYKMAQSRRTCCPKEQCYMATSISNTGYVEVHLNLNGKRKTCFLHRLLAMAFIPNPLGLPQVNHIDGDKLNNQVENLEWVTAQQNVLHAYRLGLYRKIAKQRKVVHLPTEQIFPSIKAAANAFDISYNTLKNRLNGHRKNNTDFLYYDEFTASNEMLKAA